MVLFKKHRDRTQMINLAKRMCPGRVKYMQEAFRDATSINRGYFVRRPQTGRMRTTCACVLILYRNQTKFSMPSFRKYK